MTKSLNKDSRRPCNKYVQVCLKIVVILFFIRMYVLKIHANANRTIDSQGENGKLTHCGRAKLEVNVGGIVCVKSGITAGIMAQKLRGEGMGKNMFG